MIYVKTFTLIVFLIVINIMDIKCFKIKNTAVLPILLLGLIYGIISRAFLSSLFGMLIPMVLFPLYLMRMLGAGDIKAFCAIGAVVGFELSLFTMAASFISGGVIAVIIILFKGNFLERMKYLWSFLKNGLLYGIWNDYNFGGNKNGRFCFSFAITAGTVITWGYVLFFK